MRVGGGTAAPYALALLALALHHTGEEERALALLKECFRLDPENRSHCRTLREYLKALTRGWEDAQSALRTERHQQAAVLLRGVLVEGMPRRWRLRVWAQLCNVLVQLRHHEELPNNINEAVEACSTLIGPPWP